MDDAWGPETSFERNGAGEMSDLTDAQLPNFRGLPIMWPKEAEPELKPRSLDVKPSAHSTPRSFPALGDTHPA